MGDHAFETVHPWISSYVISSHQISLPKTVQEAGSSSELWAVRIPSGVNVEMLQSSKWEKISQKLGGVVWTTNVEGTRYFLEEVSMNSPCYAIDQVNPALTRPVVRQLMIHAGKNGNPCDHDIDQPIYIGLAKAESKKKRKK